MSSGNLPTYDAVIVGGGLSGITTAYMLRNKNILLLEKEDRFGGRVESEQIYEMTNNVGTQFFSDVGGSLTNLMDELGIDRLRHKPRHVPYAFYIDGEYYPDLKDLMSFGVHLDRLKLLARAIPRFLTFLKPDDHPKRRQLIEQNIVRLYDGLRPETQGLIYSYMRGACLAKPERTSAGIGAALMLGAFFLGENSWVTGGFQQVTDRMLAKLDGVARHRAEVTEVEEVDGLVRVTYIKDDQQHVVTARGAAITTPAPIVARIVPELPEPRRDAFERVKYGPLTMVSLIFDKEVPWNRFFAMGSDDTIFQMVIDQTFNTAADDNPANPVVCNFVISQYPDETDEIQRFAELSDDQIVEMTLADFTRVVPRAEGVDELLIDGKVKRYPIGEIELSPEYYVTLLPHLAEPLGNIHFAGDYTHPLSFVDGAVHSAFRVARALGSDLVESEEEERYMKVSTLIFK